MRKVFLNQHRRRGCRPAPRAKAMSAGGSGCIGRRRRTGRFVQFPGAFLLQMPQFACPEDRRDGRGEHRAQASQKTAHPAHINLRIIQRVVNGEEPAHQFSAWEDVCRMCRIVPQIYRVVPVQKANAWTCPEFPWRRRGLHGAGAFTKPEDGGGRRPEGAGGSLCGRAGRA